jgi:hypothetical protein
MTLHATWIELKFTWILILNSNSIELMWKFIAFNSNSIEEKWDGDTQYWKYTHCFHDYGVEIKNNSKKTLFHYIPSKFETKVDFGRMTQLQEPKAINIILTFM